VIGQIRRRFSVRSRSTARDGRGETSSTYTEKFRAWGEVPREGVSRLTDDPEARRSDGTFRLRFRYRPGFAIGDQIVDLGSNQALYVSGVYPVDTMRMWLQIVATESPVVQTP
jgi:head-tail adaptor